MAATPTTPIRRDDTSRLVRDSDGLRLAGVMENLEYSKRYLEVIPLWAIYSRRDETPEGHRRWLEACKALIGVDHALAAAIATWNGKYTSWPLGGPHPTPDGVTLACTRVFPRGLRTVRAQYDRRLVLSDACIEHLVFVVDELRSAAFLMAPAAHKAGSKVKVSPKPEVERWYDNPTPDQCVADVGDERCQQPSHRDGLCRMHLARHHLATGAITTHRQPNARRKR